jgi:hypothetical protein
MTSPSETASHHQVMPDNDQDMPDLDQYPGGATLAGDPESPGPPSPGIRALPPRTARQRNRASPARLTLRLPSPSPGHQ